MKRIPKKIKVAVFALFVGASSISLLAFDKGDDNYFEISKNLDIFATLYREVNMYYVDETNPGDMVKTAIDAMLEKLDPYTNYIPESDIEDHRFMTTGQYGGIGALVRQKGDYIYISEPYEDKPAQKAGLMAGDALLEVDGKSVKGKQTADVVKMLKGVPNTKVSIKVKRDGSNQPLEFSVMREEIKINNVPYFGMVDDKIGYIKLSGFTEDAGKEVKDALVSLKATNPGIEGVILDLRDNPGGLLREAINISNVFVNKGLDIVSTKGKVKEWDKTYKALNTPVDTDIPLVVLVSRGSASASEIVSGTMQDLDRGVIIGQRSYGKGLVQTTRPLSYNSQVKITTSKYYIPSGRCIQALDYTHRNEDGSVGKIPDSLMTAFKTKNGRVVYDGGGVNPDYKTPIKKYSQILQSLVVKSLVFDYATKYKLEHPTIAKAKDFKLSDAEYEDFVKWLGDKEYDYTTKSEEMLDKLKSTAEGEKYFDGVSKEFQALKDGMMHDKKADLYKFKGEIKEFLEGEIVGRYYYQKGKIEASFKYDTEITEGVKILYDKPTYSAILTGKYKQPNAPKEDGEKDDDGDDDGGVKQKKKT
ncbi:MAG: S41 family peptidase [Sphingobacteriales bacterium JAD_PAG50586_3]|nr:MAG: S41 family peptidase [Sphingobacteriales bacterium JAD_PAG50586_3]